MDSNSICRTLEKVKGENGNEDEGGKSTSAEKERQIVNVVGKQNPKQVMETCAKGIGYR